MPVLHWVVSFLVISAFRVAQCFCFRFDGLGLAGRGCVLCVSRRKCARIHGDTRGVISPARRGLALWGGVSVSGVLETLAFCWYWSDGSDGHHCVWVVELRLEEFVRALVASCLYLLWTLVDSISRVYITGVGAAVIDCACRGHR